MTNMQLNKAIKNRWSPRVFCDKEVTQEMIDLLFEAARWAPSSINEQPWRYYYAHRNHKKHFDEMVALLTGNNPGWAQHAQVLAISLAKKKLDYKNRPNNNALHDLGAANVSIAIQAAEMGLQVHQMGGFDKEKAVEYLQLDPNDFQAVTMMAMGFEGEVDLLAEDAKMRKLQHRTRKELNEFVFDLNSR